MTDEDCRCIHRANRVDMPTTNVAPRDPHDRQAMAEFLGAKLMKPLYHSAQQHHMSVEHSLNTMSHAERVYLEIEMTERTKAMHSYDYDALR
jgi:hypothetical protein